MADEIKAEDFTEAPPDCEEDEDDTDDPRTREIFETIIPLGANVGTEVKGVEDAKCTNE